MRLFFWVGSAAEIIYGAPCAYAIAHMLLLRPTLRFAARLLLVDVFVCVGARMLLLRPTLRLAARLLLADVVVGVSVRVLGLAHHTGVEYVLRTLALACALQPPLI